jgi:putative ABC transport system permease protein
VRLADILGLVLSALWQQKVRTLLTTLGVLFGSFVFAASLSISQGIQETIERESHRSDYLRRIDLHPRWGVREQDIPPEELRVRGDMSDAKRERIRKALVSRKVRFNPGSPGEALTRERLQSLSGLDHVVSVEPIIRLSGWAVLGDRTETAEVVSAKHDDTSLRKRVVAGRFLDNPDERGVVVNEFLLYHLGLSDDAAVQGVVGQRLRLEFRIQQPGAGIGLYLLKPGGAGTTPEEMSALDKIKKQLPEALDRFDLAPGERDALRNAVRELPPKAGEVIAEEFPILGVLRLPSDEELKGRWDLINADVFLPVRTAEDLFFRAPALGERGVDQAAVIVDREDNVKQVLHGIEQMGLNGYAALEYIDRERLIYLLIFGAMTFVAGVALLVAALGIANTMLMSVLERTREVGIMKAVGARNAQVQLMFLVEGALIGLVGGGLGLLMAWAVSFPADTWVRSMVSRDLKVELKESLFVFPVWLIALVLLFAVLVTTLAAVYPARRAAKVDPIAAMRHE